MQGSNPPAETIVTLRVSRVAILQRLIVLGMQLLAGVKQRMDLGAVIRISRWLKIAILLRFHVRNGALDTPRQPRKARATDDDFKEAAERPESECLFDRERNYEREVQRYLDRPFGEVIALICKGLGITPDWQAWA